MHSSPRRLMLILSALFCNAARLASAAEPGTNLTTTTPAPVSATPSTDPAREARLAWWREAKFGMFIHWGVYSALAGEWKGVPVKGYSEHIMRLAKIPRQTYLDEVVRPFNPTAFNADEWVRKAKETGMQYIIITAMHHDGVAMFDSKVDDYNVMATSKFGRDPLKELKAACDRQGIKLGFYYSHAIDWSLSGDPRYPEPNGPERRKACVERKALPQILELLRNYHPALLWGDTPHLNPKELNEQILQAIRKEDQGVIINGRLAGADQGDYLTTTDRPAEFPLMNGAFEKDWEGIPTTNESYGYHRDDKSHKPPSHFIRLLAKAAARGGNLLMNIGPMGDGKFAPEDVLILDAIGKWWSVNGASIRGTERTPLAPQMWGESTFKGNSLYLHVFQWPSDGHLLVGGLKGEVRRIVLMTDQKHELPFERKGQDLEISVPKECPDSSDSVILVECKARPEDDPSLLLQTTMTNTLSVFFGELLGKLPGKDNWGLGKGQSISSHVKGWSRKECAVRWNCRIASPGSFLVTLNYDAPADGATTLKDTIGGTVQSTNKETFGGTFIVRINKEEFKSEVRERGIGISIPLGRVTLMQGPVTVEVSTDSITGKELMRLKGVTLVPEVTTPVH
jgi:hypothetical protein